MHPGYKSSIPTGTDAIAAQFQKGNFKIGTKMLQHLIESELASKQNRAIAIIQNQLNDLQEQTNIIGRETNEARDLVQYVEERVEALETPNPEPTMVPERFQLTQVTFLGITLPSGEVIDINELPQIMGAQDAADYIGCSRHKVYTLIKDKSLEAQKATTTRQYVIFRRSLVRFFESSFDHAGRVVRVRQATENPAYNPPRIQPKKVARVKRKK